MERYLKPINMEHMAKAFHENNINGAVLLALEVNETWVCYAVQLKSLYLAFVPHCLNPLSGMYDNNNKAFQ